MEIRNSYSRRRTLIPLFKYLYRPSCSSAEKHGAAARTRPRPTCFSPAAIHEREIMEGRFDSARIVLHGMKRLNMSLSYRNPVHRNRWRAPCFMKGYNQVRVAPNIFFSPWPAVEPGTALFRYSRVRQRESFLPVFSVFVVFRGICFDILENRIFRGTFWSLSRELVFVRIFLDIN